MSERQFYWHISALVTAARFSKRITISDGSPEYSSLHVKTAETLCTRLNTGWPELILDWITGNLGDYDILLASCVCGSVNAACVSDNSGRAAQP